MNFSSVIDSQGFYKTYVRKDENGAPMYYVLSPGERCIEAVPPFFRGSAGDGGLVRPLWNENKQEWTEGASAEDVEAFDAQHPAIGPAPPLESRVNVLETETAAISAAIERGLAL